MAPCCLLLGLTVENEGLQHLGTILLLCGILKCDGWGMLAVNFKGEHSSCTFRGKPQNYTEFSPNPAVRGLKFINACVLQSVKNGHVFSSQ